MVLFQANQLLAPEINNFDMTACVERATSKTLEVLSRPFLAGDLMMPVMQGQFGSPCIPHALGFCTKDVAHRCSVVCPSWGKTGGLNLDLLKIA